MTGVWRVYATWRATPSTPAEETCTNHPDWPSARREARQLACLRGTRYVSVQDPNDIVRGGWDYCTNRWRDYPNHTPTRKDPIVNLDLLNTAHAIAPEPDRDGTTTQWAVHHAARALAAYATFRRETEDLPPNPQPGSRPDLGLLMLTATSALAAAVALTTDPAETPARIWDLTPEAGALNGESEEWLTDFLAGHGINPAAVYPYLDPADFPGTATLTATEETRRHG